MRREIIMSNKPERVELYEHGRRKLTLTRSAPSLNGVDGYTGRATSAKIWGPAGSVVTFYDDREFRRGENHVTIEKLVDEPIEVPLAAPFVKLTKHLPFLDLGKVARVIEEQGGGDPRALAAGKVIAITQSAGLGQKTSTNYQVNNTSSVHFGS